MAKNKRRMNFGLICPVCKTQNYVTTRNKLNTESPLKLNKYCDVCQKHTDHTEKKKLD